MKKKKTAVRTKKSSGRKSSGAGSDASLRTHLIDVLKGGAAHVHFMDALEQFPVNKRGTFAPGLPHTGWQLLEHSRIAQWDILEFSRNPKHVSPGFPEGYWPKTPGPPTAAAFSLIMLANTDSGDAYTFAEYEKMFRNAGFAKTTLHPVPEMPQQVLVSEKSA